MIEKNEKCIKYPRTYHLPFSETISRDDKRLEEIPFENKPVIVTIKMDGQNLSLYKDFFHTRSLDNRNCVGGRIKKLWEEIRFQIPENYRICGEDVTFKHAIHYKNLCSFFMVFSIWDELKCLSWDDTMEWCELLNLKHTPIIYQGVWNKDIILKNFYEYKNKSEDEVEGFVVRIATEFHYNDFKNSVAKFVRKNHVQNKNMWYDRLIENELGEMKNE